jgi:hypothetical protein
LLQQLSDLHRSEKVLHTYSVGSLVLDRSRANHGATSPKDASGFRSCTENGTMPDAAVRQCSGKRRGVPLPPKQHFVPQTY